MADSDDEYDRKRRDKFRGERTESYRGGEGGRRTTSGDDRRRDDWMERDSWGSRNRQRQDYRDYRTGSSRDRYSPPRQHDISPPMKRMRPEWRGGYGGAHEGYGGGNYGSSWQQGYSNAHGPYGSGGSERDSQQLETQPPMQSFKQFLQTQDDNISDDEAIRKYNEYKLDFKRLQLNEFFVTHKDEEWFKIKYHPEEAIKRKEEQMAALTTRVNVFMEFVENGRLDKLSVDNDQSEQLVNLLDAVVIRLEGGTEFDLQVLEETKSSGSSSKGKELTETVDITDDKKSDDGKDTGDKKDTKKPADDTKPPTTKGKKRKREYDSGNDDDSGSDSGEEGPSSPIAETSKNGVNGNENDAENTASLSADKKEDILPEDLEEEKKVEMKDEDEEKMDVDAVENDNKSDQAEHQDKEEIDEKESDEVKSETLEEKEKEDGADKSDAEQGPEEAGDESKKSEDGKDGKESDVPEQEAKKKEEKLKPRPLHRTASIFLRNLAPTITKQEVEAMCKRYPGFLRVAIADPQPDRRWFRRGWVTFERQVNIKEICWNLNNIRLRDCELGAIVNRDLSRRIRTVSGITSHKQVVRHDIKLTAKIVHNLDEKAGLWVSENVPDATDNNENEKKEEPQEPKEVEAPKAEKPTDSQSFGLLSKNPVLKNITDYLIEEASAEEEELLGQSTDQEEGQVEEVATVDRDDQLTKVLDKLLLYLRIVHSVDYYNHCEYPNEDEMPNRCGIMHARGTPPSTKVTQQEITDYCRMFEQKIASFLQPASKIADEEYSKLGAKEADSEVEKFVQANTQELAKDKWLCPLSGKKFKGPEFVRKHIFNKHGEKVEEVKKEVEYFNNYLKDPKRPQLPEHPSNRPDRKGAGEGSRDNFAHPPAPYQQQYPMNYNAPRHGNFHYGGGSGGGGSGGGSYGGGGYGHGGGYNSYSRGNRGGYNRGSDYRPVIHYRDLDAPREPDEFI
ncbi:serrate RNA effector molecule homolog isoform X2 [Frankliniella occidentalis]|uniref:Serrate RNA effector molecule homolog n=1 Tax=Frankliniella occidentalis TaxID=133901 RepID=A0A6J1TP10_FRAOC|nr:serrate RNA effector molecule homolog isoform X2 [Frankliniella occidentalis]